MSEAMSSIEATNLDSKLPHLLKYMGSKREILDFVVGTIKSLNVQSEWMCDLMSGTGIVGGALKGSFNIHANDIQLYSSILAKTYLLNIKGGILPGQINIIKAHVIELVNEFKSKHLKLDYNYEKVTSLNEFIEVENKEKELLKKKFDIGFHLFIKYYSGTYWSLEQCIWIDSIRAVAEMYNDTTEYYAILSSLIFAMSYTSQSTGHYAQYRDATDDNWMNDLLVCRKKNIWEFFEKKFNELIISVNGITKKNKVTTLDYADCLRILPENSIIYADPPYQSVHYSRFYHALETLIKYDYPKIQYKGRYREDRHQSPFCKKTTVENAFKKLFAGVNEKNSHLVLSYSGTGMIELPALIDLSKNEFKSNYSFKVESIDHIHSKLGRSDKKKLDVTEYLLIFKRE